MEAKRSRAGRHGLSSTGTFLTQVPVQCQELQEMTEGNFRNSVPGKTETTWNFTLAGQDPDQAQH